MRAVPGTLQEGGAAFHTTHWTVVLLASQRESPTAAQQALTRFCQDYWPPLYAFLRRRGHSSSDAQDLTQGFFASLLKQDTLSRANREKGRLRTFLLGSLQHFLADEHDRAQAFKRGGGKQIVSMEDHLAQAESALLTATRVEPAICYDQLWAATLVSRAWDQLSNSYATEGKAQLLEQLKPFVVGGSAKPPDQSEVATRLGIPVATVRTSLLRLRQRYREALRLEVARTVSETSEIDEELHYLFRLLMA